MKTTKICTLILLGAVGLAMEAGAVGPYQPPCEDKMHILESVRSKFEKCLEKYISAEGQLLPEQVKEKCPSDFTNYLNVIGGLRLCRDHEQIPFSKSKK